MVAILNWDIISVICAELGRCDLLHVALTSKTFLEPALDHLWRGIDDLYPLLCVLPDTMEIDDQKVSKLKTLFGKAYPRYFAGTIRARRRDILGSSFILYSSSTALKRATCTIPRSWKLCASLNLCNALCFTKATFPPHKASVLGSRSSAIWSVSILSFRYCSSGIFMYGFG